MHSTPLKPNLEDSRLVLTTVENAIASGAWKVDGRNDPDGLLVRLRSAILVGKIETAADIASSLAADALQAISSQDWVIPIGQATDTLSRLARIDRYNPQDLAW